MHITRLVLSCYAGTLIRESALKAGRSCLKQEVKMFIKQAIIDTVNLLVFTLFHMYSIVESSLIFVNHEIVLWIMCTFISIGAIINPVLFML